MKKIFLILSLCFIPFLIKAMTFNFNNKTIKEKVIKILKQLIKHNNIQIKTLPPEFENDKDITTLVALINQKDQTMCFRRSIKNSQTQIQNLKRQAHLLGKKIHN